MKLIRYAEKPGDSRNEGIFRHYAADRAQFLKHPGHKEGVISVSGFKLDLDLDAEITADIHVSGDSRYEWFIDGKYAGMGPDRSDENHWAFASYHLTLEKGKHVIRAIVYFTGKEEAPHAQITLREGFLFAVSQPEYEALFNTGKAPWKVRDIKGLEFLGGWGAGHLTRKDVTLWNEETPFVDPVPQDVIHEDNEYGEFFGYVRLHPSNLPEQLRRSWKGAKTLRAELDNAEDVLRITEDLKRPFELPLTLGPETEKSFVLDFEDYLCAYPVLTLSGGENAEISMVWYESAADEKGNKADRDVIAGKEFGKTFQRDDFVHLPGTRCRLSVPWWRSGRYFVLKIRTKKQSLTLEELDFEETRYPLEQESEIDLGNAEYNAMIPMLRRALQCCAHETYVDCPYYEQLLYVGDLRLEMLATSVISRDCRLQKRAMDLFSWSRSCWAGLMAERWPSKVPQLSATFSMIYPLIVRDYLMYRGFEEEEFRKIRLGIRTLLLTLEEYVNPEGLLENLPGWSFVDWPSKWCRGVPGHGKSSGKYSVFSMHYLAALAAARELEAYLPDEDGGAFDSYLKSRFERTAAAVKKVFWCPGKGLFSDDEEKTLFSVHAQSLALIAGVLDLADAEKCIYAIRDSKTIVRPTISFISYYFEALKKYGFGDWIFNELSAWKIMAKDHAVTTWETEENTRSDCHGWGSHLLYQYYAAFAGIRPDAPGFRKVRVTPSFGPLEHIYGKMVHPEGMIEFDLKKDGKGKLSGRIVLPGNCSGKFAFAGRGKLLNPGINTI